MLVCWESTSILRLAAPKESCSPAPDSEYCGNSGGFGLMELNQADREVVVPNPDELAEEQKLIRRMQMMMNMVMQVIAQDATLTVDEASQMIADSRKAALSMFPGKELAYDLIWRPRFQRLMRERFRMM
jgi:hypothetical protein